MPELKSATAGNSLAQRCSGQVLDTPSTCSVRPTRCRNPMQSITTARVEGFSSGPHLIQQRPPASYQLSEEG